MDRSSQFHGNLDHVTPENFPEICRACLCQIKYINPIPLENETFRMLFKSCTALLDQQQHAEEEGYLPSKLCQPCFDKCTGFHQFRMMCQESLRILQTFIEYVDEETLVDECAEESFVAKEEQQEDEIQEEVEDGGTARIEFVDLNLSQTIIYDDGEEEVLESELMEVTQDGMEYLGVLESDEGVTVEEDKSHLQIVKCEKPAFYVEIACPVCPRIGPWDESFHEHLKEHIESHGDVFPFPFQFPCPVQCGEEFEGAESDALLRHIYKHTEVGFPCPQCQVCYGYPLDLLDHLRDGCFDEDCKEEALDVGSVLNEKIPPQFKSRRALSQHEVHHGTSLICRICGRKLKDKTSLDRHILRHMNDRPHKCHLCDQSFVFANELASHIEYHNPDNHKYQCSKCDRKYFFKRSLVAHLARNHKERVRDQVCTVCDKGFFDLTALKKHLLIHTGEKPFECPECHTKFVRSDHLKTHMKIHSRSMVKER